MTRRKRTPPRESPRQRGAFAIPNSLAQLSALSRSLAQRTDSIHGVNKDTEDSGIVARAQALSNSPPQDAPSSGQDSKPIRWKHDQKEFADTQIWVQPTPSAGARSHAKALERQWREAQALEMSREADMRASVHGRQSFPPTSMPPRDYATGVDPSLQSGAHSTDVAEPQQLDQSPDPDGSPAAGRKRKRVEFNAQHQHSFSDSQPWAKPTARGAPRSFDDDTEQRRRAIVTKLMQTGPVSVSSAGTNIQVPTNPASRVPPDHAAQQLSEVSEALDLGKDSSQIAQLIAKKRAENAATGQLNRLQYLQAEHHRHRSGRQSWPGTAQPPSYLSMPVQPAATLPVWPASPSPAPVQPSIENTPAHNQTGYAEASTASAFGADNNAEIDLRSLFSSAAHSPNPENHNEEDDPEGALRSAISNAAVDGPFPKRPPVAPAPASAQPQSRDATSPSDQLLSNLAHVSSDALAQLNTQDSTSNQRPVPLMVPPPFMAPPPSFPANKLPQLAARKFHRPPIQTPQAQAKVAATLTPQQQELMLLQRHTEKREMESKTQELRKAAEERAKQLQAQNQMRHEQNQQQQSQQQEPTQQDQGQWLPQPSTMARSTGNTARWQAPQDLWSSTDMGEYGADPHSYAQSGSMSLGGMVKNSGGDVLQRPTSAGYGGGFPSGGKSTTARFRNASQMAFDVPKR